MVECTDGRGNKPCQPTESPCSSPCLCQRKLAADLIIAVEKNLLLIIALSNSPSLVGLTDGTELAVDEPAAKPASSDEILGARANAHSAAEAIDFLGKKYGLPAGGADIALHVCDPIVLLRPAHLQRQTSG